LISSLHQLHVSDRQSVVKGDLTNAQPTPDETSYSTTPSLSTQMKLQLFVTPTYGNRTLPVSSREWKALRNEILLRDNRTCSSCGHLSPYPHGRYMVINHIDGDASNNNPSNLRIHCSPCDAIRRCGFAGLQNWITVSESSMEQVEIVRKTRETFKDTGVIPDPNCIDPSVKPVGISAVHLANMMLKTPWKDLPEEFQRLRGFFKKRSIRLFRDSFLTGDPDTEETNENSTEALPVCNNSNRRATEIEAYKTSRPWISYSEEFHESAQAFLDLWLPSKTLKSQITWISVHNRQSEKFEVESPDLDALSSAWDKISAEGPFSVKQVDKLAEQFKLFTGKWLIFVPPDRVDNLWGQVVKSTLAGTLGFSAKVSTRDERDRAYKHIIYVYNSNYRSMAEVIRVRDELRRLGVTKPIAYKPEIYRHCGIFQKNRRGVQPSLYFF